MHLAVSIAEAILWGEQRALSFAPSRFASVSIAEAILWGEQLEDQYLMLCH